MNRLQAAPRWLFQSLRAESWSMQHMDPVNSELINTAVVSCEHEETAHRSECRWNRWPLRWRQGARGHSWWSDSVAYHERSPWTDSHVQPPKHPCSTSIGDCRRPHTFSLCILQPPKLEGDETSPFHVPALQPILSMTCLHLYHEWSGHWHVHDQSGSDRHLPNTTQSLARISTRHSHNAQGPIATLHSRAARPWASPPELSWSHLVQCLQQCFLQDTLWKDLPGCFGTHMASKKGSQ